MMAPKRILLYGYGNPGREDDGLGIYLIDEIEKWIAGTPLSLRLQLDSNYQLNVEDAETISHADLVIFIDASKEPIRRRFAFSPVTPSKEVAFTMHSVSPGYLLHLCEILYGARPQAFMLSIRGYKWQLKEGLCARAKVNLERAVEFIKKQIMWHDLVFQLTETGS